MFVSVNNLNFSYAKGKKVLDKVSFELGKGENLAIAGPSGCGKSTLLRILSGILPMGTDNTLPIDVSIGGMNPDEYRRLGKLAFMFQDSTLMPNLSVRDNIELPLRIRGRRDSGRVDGIMSGVGLTDYASYFPSQLSGGMKTRVALARSFVTGPELLFLDEPFSALDIVWKSKLYKDLQELAGIYSTTLVFVTHDVQEALLLSDDVLVLSKEGSPIEQLKQHSTTPVTERVNSISKYSISENYQNNFVRIQQALINDGVRSTSITGAVEADRILERITEISRNGGNAWPSFLQDTFVIRPYSNNPRVFKILLDAFRRESASSFRYGLIWDILNFDDVSDDVRAEMREFYLRFLDSFQGFTMKAYGATPENLFDIVFGTRIRGSVKKYPLKKKFIYLCDLYHSSEHARVIRLLDDVIAGDIRDLDDTFGKETAAILKARIESKAAQSGKN